MLRLTSPHRPRGYNEFGDALQPIQRIWQLRSIFSFSPRLILSSYFQYDTDSHGLGMNTRLRWTLRPGNDLFVVWNRNWEHPIDAPRFKLDPQTDELTVKVRFVWRG